MTPTIRNVLTDSVLRLPGRRPHYSGLPWWQRALFLVPYLRTWYKTKALLENGRRP